MIFNLSDATALKNKIAERFSVHIHFHDCCGGQYFTVDQPTEDLKVFITEYFAERKLKVIFSEDGAQFSIKEHSQSEAGK